MPRFAFDSLLPPIARLALFLDFDGTLVDIAPAPALVDVPPDLGALLVATEAALDGALAIVSGRRLDELRRWIAPYDGAVAAEHGVVIRRGGREIRPDRLTPRIPAAIRTRIRALADTIPGVIVEEKTRGISVHFRMAPEAGGAISQMMNDSIERLSPHFEILRAHMAYEIRPAGIDKGTAVAALMAAPPFSSRIPVHIGDDETDCDAFAVVERLGGVALRVAEDFDGAPTRVRAWLAGLAARATPRDADLGDAD